KYAQGQNSRNIDLAAYLTTRMPATFAAITHVLQEMARMKPDFSPTNLADVGAGPGTASWAALHVWPQIAHIKMIEADKRFAALAQHIAQNANLTALTNATMIEDKLASANVTAEMIVAAYVFAELPEHEAAASALKLWAQSENLLVIIEPGTPRGFARIRSAREALLGAGANIVGPCTHAKACPMAGQDWCHFAVRLARSREHMHAKQATVPFEDENFAWVAVSREVTILPEARIIKPTETNKFQISMPLCSAEGLTTRVIATRNKAAYKMARKKAWGDAVGESGE
ncbi:MAG: SAM-dependent methyltransferase, partial [Alphaproteobacteria bacterium]|nr:SAM-dependent methyltransferase [Alphaproteobacteria bacterium]